MSPQAREIKKPHTETRSFRLPSKVIETLDDEAARQKVSTNTLVTQLLSTYVEYDRHLNKFGFVKLTSHTFGSLLLAMTDEDIAERDRESAGLSIPKAYCLEKFGAYNVGNLHKFIMEFSSYSGLFQSSIIARDGKTYITLTHRFGRNGSRLFGNYFKHAFELLNIAVKTDATDGSVTVQY